METTRFIIIIALGLLTNASYWWLNIIFKKKGYDKKRWYDLSGFLELYRLIGKEIDPRKRFNYKIIFYCQPLCIIAILLIIFIR